MTLVHALVPLKTLGEAKSRLAGVLLPAERSSLVAAMVRDVLQVLCRHPEVEAISLVSEDPQVQVIAEAFGVGFIAEGELQVSGLNAVIDAAASQLARTGAERLLVLHGDIPTLGSDDLSNVLATLKARGGLVIGTDHDGVGTNLLAFAVNDMPQFHFGEGSCDLHHAWAEKAGLPVAVIKQPGIALDIDDPMDLVQLLGEANAGTHTHAYLQESKLAARVMPPSADKWQALKEKLVGGELPDRPEALSLATVIDTAELAQLAGAQRDRGHGNTITYSRKVFIPLTKLCRDVCHYCTFAQTPKKIDQPFMPVEEVLALCREGAAMGCQEALFTLGEKPELRYNIARKALAEMGYESTLDYVKEVAGRVLAETGLLPHINAGCMTAEEIASLREVSASMGIMLESASPRLCEKGMPHYGSPDKNPDVRLETLELAGQAAVPFTSGILIGIGETRRERVESMLSLRDVHLRHGHLQEVIVQNFRAKPGTLMANAPEPNLEDMLWTIAVARLVFGPEMSIQAPPNLSPGVLPQLVAAGINDWGGVSPLTPDHVNPEAPWPHLDKLARETASAGKFLDQRLTIYPAYAQAPERWLDKALHAAVLDQSDSMGFARRDDWVPGEERPVPAVETQLMLSTAAPQGRDVDPQLRSIVERCRNMAELDESEVVRLFEARGRDFSFLVSAANELRETVAADRVSYVVNRNINYTNVCYFKCQFCAFSKGKASENLRGKPYDISGDEIARRCREAWARGATEVCMQGGIHPDYTGQTYLDILRTVRTATPDMHIHAFSPLEVLQGAETLGLDVETFLRQLKAAGLNTLPGTAAEILHDAVRARLCPDKLNSQQWLEVMETAHSIGLRTTATIMYGHIEKPRHWAHHLLQLRALQQRTGGFTEFVPLPFVHMEAPMYLKGNARRGPTFREAVLMHAVARLVFHGWIDNIQTSWVKMGEPGVQACLQAGCNDLGGTLMNESITRAAGSDHGQEWPPARMEAQIRSADRRPRMRNTLYGNAPGAQRVAAFNASPLAAPQNTAAAKVERSKLIATVQLGAREAVRVAEELAFVDQVFLVAACD
ncbi:5-amino-6-(D-ribitylamino)uracil--L-tyrosine 4-hydroxyphenyl transferase CofH [Candidatus Seongchinamella marina]|uniref:5-amino-6-(D-ribitylamino)uracil--L-tyrosine 4-hydroxyphenyl transferase CofH n=1 Tax=Candidatus Seongchinamella marina TaxID=2518990 RepID=UPI00242CE0D7|nr:5-amino-6-(D-ribitylamino)uracil--L-tyrosine 4-hydroxyphenyl transferase CofH [Candidatus Seongchinamella marina]